MALAKPRRLTTIRASLARLVLVAILPVLLATAGLLYQVQSDARTSIQRDVSTTARALMMAVDRDLANAQTAALVMSKSPDLQTGDLRAFYSQAIEMVRSGVASNVILTTKSGQQALNVLVPYGEPLPVTSNLDLIQQVFATRKPAISDLHNGTVRHQPLISVYQPVFVKGQMTYILNVALYPERLWEILNQEHLPPGWIASVVDHHGSIVARTQAQDKYLGREANPEIAQQIRSHTEGVVETNTRDGVSVTAIFSRSAISGWTVVIAVPTSELIAQRWNSLKLTLGSTAILILLGLMIARIQARRLAKPIGALEAMALAHGRGELVERPRLRLKEADDVARALAEGAQQLRARTAERDRAYAQSHRVTIEKELVEKQARARSAYFAYLTHELGSPLMAIRAFAGATANLVRGTPEHRKCLDYCERIDTTTTHLMDIIGEILSYARLDAHEITLQKQDIDVGSEIRNIIKIWKVKAEREKLTLGSRIAPKLPTFLVDRVRFRQILFNLLSNAVKFTLSGGNIKVIAGVEGTDLVIRIADTGVGISAEELPLVLQPFAQAANAQQEGREGSGLGLPFAKGLVELHGGTLELESTLGAGTTVSVRFPLQALTEPRVCETLR
ncbi:MAG TPA: sensor histidine kinase [Stellaceae bacterium]|nr:sensor histidine kinase [Stellaceae bacterium]